MSISYCSHGSTYLTCSACRKLMGNIVPLYEFKCPIHNKTIEVIWNATKKELPICPVRGCKEPLVQVEFSVPARRDPAHGIQE